jgi:membrane protein
MKTIIDILKKTYSEWSEDKASRLAAALAYYSVISLAPILVILIAIAGLVFGKEAAQGQVVSEIRQFVGDLGAEAIQTVIVNTSDPQSGTFATIFGVITLLFGASGVFAQLQDGMNTIWEVQPKPGRGIFAVIKDRFLSLTMVLGVGFLLLVSLGISAALAAFGKFLGGILPLPEVLLAILNFIISFCLITLLFAMIFKFLPDVKIGWRDVWIGAALTSFLFTLGKFILGFYLGRSSVTSAYGAAGSIVLILIWVYYSSQILFFGAEFTQVYANTYGSRIKPDKDAVPITEEARAQEGIPESKEKKN